MKRKLILTASYVLVLALGVSGGYLWGSYQGVKFGMKQAGRETKGNTSLRLRQLLIRKTGKREKASQITEQHMNIGVLALLANREQPWNTLSPNDPLLRDIKLYYEVYGYPKQQPRLKQQLSKVPVTTKASADGPLTKRLAVKHGQAEGENVPQQP